MHCGQRQATDDLIAVLSGDDRLFEQLAAGLFARGARWLYVRGRIQ
jgi:hypothetical protein